MLAGCWAVSPSWAETEVLAASAAKASLSAGTSIQAGKAASGEGGPGPSPALPHASFPETWRALCTLTLEVCTSVVFNGFTELCNHHC